MDSFLSKASSFMSSQAEQGAAPPTKDEAHRKPASSAGYGDLLAGAGGGAPKPSAEKSAHKSPSSPDTYGDLLAGAQAWMGSAKPTPKADDGNLPIDEKEAHKSSSSGGLGDLLAKAQAMSGSAKPSSGNVDASIDNAAELDAQKNARSGSYGDVLASAQVLMKAAKVSGSEADMGEAAGAAANLIGAASQYGDLEKRGYGDYANKAQAYLHDYKASHGKPVVPKEDLEDDNNKPSSNAPLKPAREVDEERE